MYRVNKFKFFLYVGVICSLLSSSSVEMFGRIDMNISFFVVLWVFENMSSYEVKYGGVILFYFIVRSVVLIVISLIFLSFIFMVVKRIRLGVRGVMM